MQILEIERDRPQTIFSEPDNAPALDLNTF
jgi:hypothetical protein